MVGYFVTLPGPCDQAFFLHQPDDPFATHLLVLLDQVFVNARAAIALFTRVKGRLDEDLQPPVVSWIVPIPGVVATRRTRCV